MSEFEYNDLDRPVLERLRDCFDQMVVYKDLKKSNFISSFKLPSFMRDWVLKRFQDDEGVIEIEGATGFIKEFIPKKEDWKAIKNRIVNYQEQVKFLAKISIEIDIKTGDISFALPDFGLSFKETVIPRNTWEMYGEALLRAEENWGIVELGYQFPEDRKPGKIKLISFKDFCPYLEFGSVKGMEMDKYLELKEKFEANRDDENAVKMAAYMRNLFSFYGLSTPKRKAIYKDFLKSEKRKKIIDWDLLNRCYADEHREFHYFVMDYLVAMQKFLKFDDVSHIEKYIKTNQWWDTIDGLDRIVGNIAFTDERINDLMLEWSTDEDFWVRRIAIDHQLCRKERTNTELLEKILVNNFGSSEFFINKAIGWSLRDYSKTNPDWVRNFVETHKDKMDKLSIREASKYL